VLGPFPQVSKGLASCPSCLVRSGPRKYRVNSASKIHAPLASLPTLPGFIFDGIDCRATALRTFTSLARRHVAL
jgi:hypothetical protein